MTETAREASDRASFAADFDISQSMLAKFDLYAALLRDWQSRMNLVGPATLPDIWTRHFADSAQLVRLGGPGAWLDIGAGAGFPGLVAAVLGADHVHLVESIGKKARFLETVATDLALDNVTVHNMRVESLARFPVANITARACASLDRLFDWGLRFANRDTRWILPKGKSVEAELGQASEHFRFHVEQIVSVTDELGRIVLARNVARR